jgi:hypothetical protein
MSSSNKNRGGKLCRREDPWPEVISEYPEFEIPFKHVRWFEYVHILMNGYHSSVALSFSQSFNGMTVTVGDLNFEVTEQYIADVCGLPLDGEHWFKNQFIVGDCNQFLKYEYKNPPWSHWMPICMLKPKWSNYLLMIQRHFIGDGKYSRFYLYHLRFLLHLIGKRMNVPYYFLRILSKMARKIQTKSDKSNQLGDSLYH